MKRFLVRCSYELIVSVPDDVDPIFAIEENSCPGTGATLIALRELQRQHEERSTCWACAANGENAIIKEVRDEEAGSAPQSIASDGEVTYECESHERRFLCWLYSLPVSIEVHGTKQQRDAQWQQASRALDLMKEHALAYTSEQRTREFWGKVYGTPEP